MRRRICLTAWLVAGSWVLAGGASLEAQGPDGAAIFAAACASCHNGTVESRAPSPEVLRQRSPEAILSALTAGGMRPQGGRLSGAERRAVAEHLSGRALGGDITGATVGRCSTNPRAPGSGLQASGASGSGLRASGAGPRAPGASGSGRWGGWSPSAANTRYQTTEQAGLSAADVPRLTLKWALGFPDATSAWSQPTVAAGRLFVGSQNGTVYALEPKSGCILWTFSAKSGVRAAVTVDSEGKTVYVGDTGGNMYALEVETGRALWSRRMDEHPYARVTGSPTFHEGRLYVPISSIEETAASQPGYECCTFRGSLVALDAETGQSVWQTFMVPSPQAMGKSAAGVPVWGPSGVGIWNAPTVDVKRGLLYVTTGNTYSGAAQPTGDAVIALDLGTGAIKWTRQVTAGDVFGCRPGSPNCGEKAGPDFDFGTPAMLATLTDGRHLIVVGQKSGMAYGMDPDREGAIVWQYRAGQGSIWGGIQWGAAVDSTQAYLPISDIRTPTPGGLHAVALETGERVWYQPPPPLKCQAGAGCNAALISAPTLIPGVLFSGSNDGALRAHATKDGAILWEFDTNREFKTLNGVRANGGAIQGAGPTVADGMLYLNSGYGDHLGRPGNVLLAFEIQ